MGGPSISVSINYVKVTNKKIQTAIALCLDEENCKNGDALAAQQSNPDIADPNICGLLDREAKKLVTTACETFENKNIFKGSSFTGYIEHLEIIENQQN